METDQNKERRKAFEKTRKGYAAFKNKVNIRVHVYSEWQDRNAWVGNNLQIDVLSLKVTPVSRWWA